MKLGSNIIELQQRLRTVQYPLRLTDDVFDASEDTLQAGRIRRRYEVLQAWHSEAISKLRREWPNCPEFYREDDGHFFNLARMKEPSQKVANDRNIKWGWDIPILMLVQMSNYEHAVSNENKFLLRDSLHGFPIMNYVLGEGPYKPPWDSVFGGDDFHCILRADDGNLIYFLPEIHGLELGHYVEVLIGE